MSNHYERAFDPEMTTTLAVYDADLPIHMKDGMVLLKETVKSVQEETIDYESLSGVVLELDRELTHGLNQIKNHGYVTEGMANGEPTPNWVPIKKEQAIKEAMEFLKTNPHLNGEKKADKRSRAAYTEEEWEEKKVERKEKANEKKRKIEEYDELVEQVETYKEKARSYKEKFLKCKAYFMTNNIDVPE